MEVSHSNAEKEPTEDNDTNTGCGETVGCRVGVLLLFIFAVSLVWNASSWLIDRHNDPKATYDRGMERLESVDYIAAIQEFNAVIRQSRTTLRPFLRSEAYNARGLAKAALHQFEGAVADYDEAIGFPFFVWLWPLP